MHEQLVTRKAKAGVLANMALRHRTELDHARA
jgi:hypothetical protein